MRSQSLNSMHYVGLDVHARQSSIEILNDRGQTVKRQTIHGSPDDVVRELAKLPHPFSICYEASCGYGTLHEKLSPLAKRAVVAHPGQLRLIYKTKRKNNRFDAGKLGRLLYLDVVPAVHVPRLDVRQWRGAIEFRHKLLSRRVALKNQIKGLLRGLHPAAEGIVVAQGDGVAEGAGAGSGRIERRRPDNGSGTGSENESGTGANITANVVGHGRAAPRSAQ